MLQLPTCDTQMYFIYIFSEQRLHLSLLTDLLTVLRKDKQYHEGSLTIVKLGD